MRRTKRYGPLSHLLFALCVLALATLMSCDNEIEMLDVDRGEAYFPLIPGQWTEYRIDSVIFDDAPGGNIKEFYTSFLREEVADFLVNTSGDTIYRLERYYKVDESDPWQLLDVWSATKSRTEATKTEENLKFLKLNFPVQVDKRWNPLIYVHENIDEEEVQVGTETIRMYRFWESTIDAVDESGQVGDFDFNASLLEVTHVDDDNELTRRYSKEIYARNLGLVSRVDTILDSRCLRLGDPSDCFGENWLQKGEKGYLLRQTLTNHN